MPRREEPDLRFLASGKPDPDEMLVFARRKV
jgi:hypothetical protein